MNKNKLNRNIIFYIVAIFLSLFIGVLMFMPKTASRFWPYKTYVIISGSMEPVISKNDVIIVKGQDDYKVGDIITFEKDLDGQGDKSLITHYIAEIKDQKIYTKPHITQQWDFGSISKQDIIGKVVSVIPKLGFLIIPMLNYAREILLITLLLVLATMVWVVRKKY